VKLSVTPSALKQLHKTPWKFQRTFKTPVKNLQPFVTAILWAAPLFHRASVTIEETVFEPQNLIETLSRYSLPLQHKKGMSVMAVGRQEIEELLRAVLTDSVDFLFIPIPKPFVIYTDHDEYTTFYANTRSNLNRVADALLGEGVEEVSEFQRHSLR